MAYKLVEKQVLFTGKRVRLEIHHLEDDEGKRMQKEVCVHPGAVVILPMIEDEKIVLIRNRRHAVGQTLIELPAGTLERGEDPMNCAGRELLEETGYLAGRLQPLGTYFTSPGVLSEKMYAFAAYDLTVQAQSLDEGEEIEQMMAVPLAEVRQMIREGRIMDAKTIATIWLYELSKG